MDRHVAQPRSYCTILNGEFLNSNPVQYFVLTNGDTTRLYQWDYNAPLLELSFEDFTEDNQQYNELKKFLGRDAFMSQISTEPLTLKTSHHLVKPPIEEVNAAFSSCHQHIYRSDNISQAAAFNEFVKIIALKLMADRQIKENYPSVLAEDALDLPAQEVQFSTAWIASQHDDNPLGTEFRRFIDDMERDIARGNRKRIFEQNEQIALRPETIRGVVERLEHLFLFGVDADLNGRLFETFLNATMRGKDLGQYFTPRSLVKLGVGLGQLRVGVVLEDGSSHTDLVLDGCCGTGGFLIDALADMWTKVNRNQSLSETEKAELRSRIANEHVYGIDVGRDPNLSRIARLNMYLHGDGGSRIYYADALDKEVREEQTDRPEDTLDKAQLRQLLTDEVGFDVVVTNPPFSKRYKRTEQSDVMILQGYDIAKERKVDDFKSALLFFERYHDLLSPGGRLVSIIDDGILSGKEYKWFRDFLRRKYLVRAIVSLPGDAFQRSKARVKTSYLVLEKRRSEGEQQPAVFMYACRYVGNDDPSRERTLPQDRIIREAAREEIQKVLDEYTAFLSGQGDQNFIVPPQKLDDRLDVKHCLMQTGHMSTEWYGSGINVLKVSDVASPKTFPGDDIIDCRAYDGTVTYLRVRYDGQAEAGGEIEPAETQHSKLYRVRVGDIVISNIAASYGSVAVVPPDLDGYVVSSEYTTLTPREGFQALVIWSVLRSPEIRADMLLVGTGANRTRVRWEMIKDIEIPYPDDTVVEQVLAEFAEAEEAERRAAAARQRASESLESSLRLNQDYARIILAAFKPPQ